MKLKFKYVDEIGITRCLGFFERATAELFGIAAGWLNNQGLLEMHDAGFIPEGFECFQVGCLPCEKAYRFTTSETELEISKLSRTDVAWEVIMDFLKQAPCRHLDQFMAFAQGIKEGGKYSTSISHHISERAKQLEVERSDPFTDEY